MSKVTKNQPLQESKNEEPLQNPPGYEQTLEPKPDSHYREAGSGKLAGKIALITGADSGIGRAVAIAFAHEGADVVCSYLIEHRDAEETKRLVENEGRRCSIIPGDIGNQSHCRALAEETVKTYGTINILVNNAAQQTVQESFDAITPEQLQRTFQTNIFSIFYLTQAVLPHLTKGDCIINTTSVTAYRGSEHLIDYAATKGAIVAFTRSLSKNLAPDIRVNAVAPGPVWTPLISSTFPQNEAATFGKDVPMGRPAQPNEIAPAYVFLASTDASYMTGQVLHPNGGEIING